MSIRARSSQRRDLLLLAAIAALASPSVGLAGATILVIDRTAHKIWRMTDDNNDNVIQSNEVHVWFDETNAAGTPNPQLPLAFNSRQTDGTVILGDNTSHTYFWFRDVDHNGDALGAGESRTIFSPANASGMTIPTPSGIGFFPNGDIMACNSGTGNTTSGTQDSIYRLHDLTGNGGYDEAGEATRWVTAWPGFAGTGNGPYTPADVVIDANGVGYLRNTSSGLFGVYKIADLNSNGRADDAGEFTPWFDASNQSSIVPNAGFGLELDLSRPHALYMNITVGSGATASKQIIRMASANADANANAPGGAVVVYSVVDSTISIQDIVSLPNGDVLFSDLSGKRVFRLHDSDGDGLFTSAGERTDFYPANTNSAVLDVRYMALLRDLPSCHADFNNSGTLTVQDIFDFLSAWFAIDPRADFNGVNGVTVQDIFDFLTAWFTGC